MREKRRVRIFLSRASCILFPLRKKSHLADFFESLFVCGGKTQCVLLAFFFGFFRCGGGGRVGVYCCGKEEEGKRKRKTVWRGNGDDLVAYQKRKKGGWRVFVFFCKKMRFKQSFFCRNLQQQPRNKELVANTTRTTEISLLDLQTEGEQETADTFSREQKRKEEEGQ